MKLFFSKDKRAELTNEFTQSLKPLVDHLGSNQFLNGAKVCIADFVFFEHIEYTQKLSGGETFTNYPTLTGYHERVKNLPGMKEYYAGAKHLAFVPSIAKIQDKDLKE